ncbi:MAG: ATPase, partial [Rhodobacterales bacterium]
MLYNSASDWESSKSKRVMLFGMSGLGKTYISEMLRNNGDWFHYSIDYRIGTRYMGEHIADNFKKEAMRTPFLAELLQSDAIYIAANMKFSDLSPLSTYLGKPGNLKNGGISFAEYLRRQRLHRDAEINSMIDTVHFIDRAKSLYNYDNFVCDTSGSVVEVVDCDDPDDYVLKALSKHVLPVWIEGSSDHTEELVRRFAAAPKPMYYQESFLINCWTNYLEEKNISEANVNPDDFILWGYRQLLENRLPRYRKIAEKWGITLNANDVAKVK